MCVCMCTYGTHSIPPAINSLKLNYVHKAAKLLNKAANCWPITSSCRGKLCHQLQLPFTIIIKPPWTLCSERTHAFYKYGTTVDIALMSVSCRRLLLFWYICSTIIKKSQVLSSKPCLTLSCMDTCMALGLTSVRKCRWWTIDNYFTRDTLSTAEVLIYPCS